MFATLFGSKARDSTSSGGSKGSAPADCGSSSPRSLPGGGAQAMMIGLGCIGGAVEYGEGADADSLIAAGAPQRSACQRGSVSLSPSVHSSCPSASSGIRAARAVSLFQQFHGCSMACEDRDANM